MKYLIVPGLCYGGESHADMMRRERAMKRHNARDDKRMAAEADARRRPLPSMIPWAIARGIYQPANA